MKRKIKLIILASLLCAGSLCSQTFEIASCEFVNMRTGPAATYPVNQRLQKGVNGIVLLGGPVFNGPTKWQKINSRGVVGWVNANFLEESRFTVVPSPTPLPTPQPDDDELNDCLIVATEMYARLKSSASWARICVFRIYANGEYINSHAVVLYQPTQASNVFFYDKTLSSIDTNTQSHDLIEIISSINQITMRKGVLFEDPRWID
jgi:uncharacterized protein YgiM (DUF1202 family)